MGTFQRIDGFPQVRYSKDGKVVVDKVWSTWEDAQLVEDTYPRGLACPDAPELALDTIDIERKQDGNRALVTLNYALADGTNIIDSNKAEYTISANGSQESLNTLKDKYYMKWDHQLIKKKGKTDFSDVDDRLNEIPNSTYPDNKWIYFDEQCPDGWVVQQKATKPGIRNWLMPSIIIHETKYYSSERSIGSLAVNVGKTKTPGKLFGLPATVTIGGVSKPTFLVISANGDKQGRKWAGRVDYQYSPTGWDSDIYDAV